MYECAVAGTEFWYQHYCVPNTQDHHTPSYQRYSKLLTNYTTERINTVLLLVDSSQDANVNPRSTQGQQVEMDLYLAGSLHLFHISTSYSIEIFAVVLFCAYFTDVMCPRK